MRDRPTLRLLLGLSRGLALAGLLVAAATGRVIYAGEGEIAASTACLKAGDPHGAAEHARRAAGWYAPGAPHVRVAYERLIALATTAEGLGDRDTAVFAWEGVRMAAIETRSILSAHQAELDRANKELARLAASAPRPPGTRTEPPAKIEREQLEALARDESPRTVWVAGLVLAALGWIGGAVWVVRRGVGATGRMDWKRALPGLVVTGAGVALWLLSIWRA
ncbi:MAG: hypothetical protein U0359_21520 [Byssovorax sp.]